jgi:opacity protein-like surface antigen
VPLPCAIRTPGAEVSICQQKTYLARPSGPSIALREVERQEILGRKSPEISVGIREADKRKEFRRNRAGTSLKMRNNSRILLLFALSAFLEGFLGSALRAQTAASEGTRPGSTEITFFVGISAPVDHESTGFGLDVKTGTPIGGRVSYNFNRHNAIEFSIANPFSLFANYVYNLSTFREKWVPYVTGGVGGTRNEIALSDNNQPAPLNSNLMETGPDRSQTVFAGNFGGGVKYFLTERFALRFDVRDQVGHYKATFSNVAGVPGGIVTGSKTLNDFQITGGIVYRFGTKH